MHATLLLAVVCGAPALKDPPRNDSGLVGEWIVEWVLINGKPFAQSAEPLRWIFRADGVRRIVTAAGEEVSELRYTADLTASPATADLTRGTEKWLCVYKIVGDTMMMNIGYESYPRPADLVCDEESKSTLYVFKRAKPRR